MTFCSMSDKLHHKKCTWQWCGLRKAQKSNVTLTLPKNVFSIRRRLSFRFDFGAWRACCSVGDTKGQCQDPKNIPIDIVVDSWCFSLLFFLCHVSDPKALQHESRNVSNEQKRQTIFFLLFRLAACGNMKLFPGCRLLALLNRIGKVLIDSFLYFFSLAVSFSGQQNGSATGAFVSSRSEPISLATLDRDCFIIPVRSLERFLPAGVPVSFKTKLNVRLTN